MSCRGQPDTEDRQLWDCRNLSLNPSSGAYGHITSAVFLSFPETHFRVHKTSDERIDFCSSFTVVKMT